MKQNIKNNHTRRLDAKLYSAKYYDFMLFKGETLKFGKNYLDNLKIADFSNFNIKDGILFSDSVLRISIVALFIAFAP